MMSAEQIITLALNPETRAPPLGITTDVTPLKTVGLNNYRWLQGVPTWDTFIDRSLVPCQKIIKTINYNKKIPF